MASESRPATDDQLRGAVGTFATQWAQDTERALNDKWDDPKHMEAILTGVSAGERRTRWAQQLTRYARERIKAFHLAGDTHRREIAEQMFALLQAVQPRPTEDEVARPTAEFRSMIAGLAPATTAGRELLAMATDIDTAVTELVDRAPVLEGERAGRTTPLTLAGEAARADLARVDQLVDVLRLQTNLAKLVIGVGVGVDIDADPPI